ncbi:MAG: hypothetical protein ACPGU5_01910 [Lishizhenia sp.]
MTKILFSIFICSITSWGNSQTMSYDFAQPLSPSGIEVETVSDSYFGSYKLDDKLFIFDENGIKSKTTIYLSISRETIRENSAFFVRNGYLFGMKKNDSIPCFLKGENYYYGLREEVEILGENTLNKLIDDGSSYYLNFYETGKWIPARLTFKGKHLKIAYFDYPDTTHIFNSIALKTEDNEDGLRILTLWPTEKEWQLLDKQVLFPKELVFNKEENF